MALFDGHRGLIVPSGPVTVWLGHLTESSTKWDGSRNREYSVYPRTLSRPDHGVAERRFQCAYCRETFAVDLASAEALPDVARRPWGRAIALVVLGLLIMWGGYRAGGPLLVLSILLVVPCLVMAAASMAPVERLRLRSVRDVDQPARRVVHRLMPPPEGQGRHQTS